MRSLNRLDGLSNPLNGSMQHRPVVEFEIHCRSAGERTDVPSELATRNGLILNPATRLRPVTIRPFPGWLLRSKWVGERRKVLPQTWFTGHNTAADTSRSPARGAIRSHTSSPASTLVWREMRDSLRRSKACSAAEGADASSARCQVSPHVCSPPLRCYTVNSFQLGTYG